MIRVALIGAGGMARQYRAVYSRMPGVCWVLSVDVNQQELAQCRELGCQRTSTRFEDALADDIDMLDVSTPNHLHQQQAVAALNAGKHVLLQKPMANSLSAADAILAAARESRGTLGMYMFSYTNPLVWAVRDMIRAGALGQLQSVRARDAHRGGLFQKPSQANWRGSREMTGGGSFIQLTTHSLNLLQWLIDAEVTDIRAFSDNQYCPNIGGDDVTVAIVRLSARDNSGPLYGVFDSGYASEGHCREIFGTAGRLRLFDNDRQLELKLDRPYESELIRYTTPGKMQVIASPPFELDDPANPYNQQRMFVEAIQQNRPPHMSGEIGRRDLAIVMRAYETARA